MRAGLPRQIDNHELLRLIGSGGYGDVFLARNTVTNTYRAIKIVWRNAFHDERPYQRELAALRRFEPISRSHPGFVQILQIGELDNAFFYIMELADDQCGGSPVVPASYCPRSLARSIPEPLPPAECIAIGLHLATALVALHRAGLIHRDIKPSNIIFVDGKAKLADIGLVTAIREANSFVGTPGFVPPEGPISPVSDVFSLGKVLYEISSGNDRYVFPELPVPLPADRTLYFELNQIILKASDHRAAKRYRSAEEMRAELQLLEAGTSIKHLRALQKRYRAGAIAFVALALAAVATFVVKAWHDRERAAVQRRVAYNLARGTDYMKDGDFASALPFFLAAAADDDPAALNHRLRVGSIVADAVRRVGLWNGPADGTFSRDGRWLVTLNSNQVEVRDSRTGAVADSVRTATPPVLARLSPDSRQLAIAAGNLFTLRDRASGAARHLELPERIDFFAFSPSGREAAFCTTNAVFFIDLETERLAQLPAALTNQILHLSYSPEGDRFLVFRSTGFAEVWQREGLRRISVPFEHSLAYAGLFDPVYKDRVLTCGFDRAVYWDIATGQVLSKPLDHQYGTYCLALSPDQKVLASGGLDRVVRLSDPRTLIAQAENPILYHPDRVLALAFDGPETLVVHCLDGSNHVWDLTPDAPVPAEQPWHEIADSCLASNSVLSLETHGSSVTVRFAGQAPREIEVAGEASTVALHPDSSQFAIGMRDDQFDHHAALIYATDNLERPLRQLEHLDGINYVKYSPSGRMIVTCSEDHTAILWDSATGHPIASPLKHGWQVRWADFTKDETALATASWDETVRLWDTQTGEPLTPPLKFGTFLHWVRFADDDRAVLAANLSRSQLLRLELPIAALPLGQYRDAIPAPGSLVVSAGF